MRSPCKQHVNLSGPFRRLLTEECYTPDGKPQVGTRDHYFCIDCGASFRNDMENGIGPMSLGCEAYWHLPVIWQKR